MKTRISWQVVPAALALLVAMTGGARSETIQIARAGQSVNVSGTSGGTVKANNCAGYIANNPNHVIKLVEASDLKWSLQGSGEPTLLINGPGGRTICLMSESGGKIEIPGLWEPGSYSVYVGDRVQGRHPYSLLISQ